MRNKKHARAKAARVALAFVLAFAMCFPLAGCKDTDVLTQLIIDQSAPLDESLEPVPAPETQGVDKGTFDEAEEDEDKQEEQPEDPSYDENDSDGETNETVNDDTSTASDKASAGTQANNNVGGLSGDGDGDGNGTDSDSNANNTITITPNGNKGEDTPNPDDQSGNQDYSNNNSTIGDATNGGGGGGAAQIYAGGTYATLPKAKSIAAVGTYAVLVQMLGGSGSLACTDANTYNTLTSSGAFPGELSGVTVGWANSGTNSSDVDIDAIVASGADLVLTSASYGGLNQALAEELRSRNVNVLEMPVIGVNNTLDEDLTRAVNYVGQMLRNSGHTVNGKTSNQMAAEWLNMHNNTLDTYLNAAGGYSTPVLNGTHKDGKLQGTLGAVNSGKNTTNHTTSNIYTSYINEVVNTNEATRTINRKGALYGVAYFYPCTSAYDGTVWNFDVSDGIAALDGRTDAVNNSYFYLLEYYFQDAGVQWTLWSTPSASVSFLDSTTAGVFANSGVYTTAAGKAFGYSETAFLFANSPSATTRSQFSALGDSDYPALVTKTLSQAQAIQSSANKPTGYYNYGTGYSIYVLPSSTITGSWQDGTPESFLSVAWAYCMFRNGGDLNACSELINNYYSTFYRSGAGALVQNYGDSGVLTAECPHVNEAVSQAG